MKKAIALGIVIMLLLNFMMLRSALVLASPSGIPNSGFEQGTLGEVPNNWTQELIDFPGENPPPQGYFEHELRQSDTAYYDGNYSLYGRAAFVHTFEKHDNNPTSETWAHSEFIDAENATRVTVHMTGIYRVQPDYWGWNSYIFLVLSDGVTSVEYTLYEFREYPLGETLEANHYNFTDTGADGQEWYGYTREIPLSLNSSNLRVSIGWYAHTWYWYYPARVEIASYVDQVSLEETHDVAILNVICDKTTVLPSQDVKINVTAGNQGSFAETFNVTAYANEKAIGQQVVSLNARESQVLTFDWNTTDFDIGDYVMSAVADAVANETNTSDNTYYDGVVSVRSPIHDVAIVYVVPSTTIVPLGEEVQVNVTVEDHGDYSETFNVTAYANEAVIGRQVASLNVSESQILTFDWNTTDFDIGDYVMSAVADLVANETNTSDNTYYDSVVQVRWHDVAVVGVVPSVMTIPFGNPVSVDVIVENQGAFAETFNVTVFANSTEIQTKTVTDLEALASKVLTFEWNTAGFPIGLYTLEAMANPVLGENDTADNTFVDGTVTVLAAIHNVAVKSITSDLYIPAASYSQIQVQAENKGAFSETFNVTVYANSSEIQTKTVSDMPPETTQILDFTWNTNGFALGDYKITAIASYVPDETQAWDNTYIDGMVTIVNQTYLYVQPHSILVQPGQTFTVDIKICNPTNVRYWQIKLYFNNTLLSVPGNPIDMPDYVLRTGLYRSGSTLTEITFVATAGGISHLNFSSPIWTWLTNSDFNDLPYQAANGTVQARNGDISLNSVEPSKTVVFQGFTCSIWCTIENKEEFQESFVTVAFADGNEIEGTQATIIGHSSASILLVWNTTGFPKGNFTISASAGPLAYETNTSDNYLTDGRIFVSMIGDLTGGTSNPWDFVPDGKVDGKDITIVAVCYGSAPGCSPPYVWNANSDVNNDAKIDGKDIALVAAHYGQADP